MTFLAMRHDFRAPADGSSTQADIYTAAMDQFRWADAHGFDLAVVSEHHGMSDGWLPAPLTMAGAIVGATERIRVFLSAVLLPLHDPIRVAEQLVVLDHLSRGPRVDGPRCGIPPRGVRHGRCRREAAGPHPRGAHRRPARGVHG